MVLTVGGPDHSSLGGRRTGTPVRLTHTPFSLGLSPWAVQSAVTSLPASRPSLLRHHRITDSHPLHSHPNSPQFPTRSATPPSNPRYLPPKRSFTPRTSIKLATNNNRNRSKSTQTGLATTFSPSSPDSSARCHFFISRAPFHHFANHHFRCCRGFN